MNVKKVIACIAAFCIIGGAVQTNTIKVMDYTLETIAADSTNGTYENLTYEKYSNHIEITGCDESAEEVVIPAEIDELPVTSIGYHAFYYYKSLMSITIPDSVTSIGDIAFCDCSSLESITIPDSVTNIGSSAFYGTPWLEAKQKENPLVIVNNILIDGKTCEGDVVIPDSVTSISGGAFAGCDGLMSITIPDSVTSIGYDVFRSCSSLTLITIPDSVTSIGGYAFFDCSGLTSIKIPDSVTSISGGTFGCCSSLTSITIPDSVTSIGNSAFFGCSSLESITIPDSVTSIGGDAFGNCSSLREITIPDGVTSIGDGTFAYCSLTSITIPNSVTSVGSGSFIYSSGLTSITIPESVENIGEYAFHYCSDLESITILNPDCEIFGGSETICNGLDDEHLYFSGTIHGYSGSTAEAYAEKYGYNFKAIDESGVSETLLGDANCDGEVSVADATLVLQYCGNKDKYKISEQGLINADVDGTAGISAVDALRIQQYDAGIIESF